MWKPRRQQASQDSLPDLGSRLQHRDNERGIYGRSTRG